MDEIRSKTERMMFNVGESSLTEDFGDLWLLPCFDIWITVCSYLTIKEIAVTRNVCKSWYTNGKEQVTLYKIGFDKNGSSQWDGDNKQSHGWGMKISVDKNGNISGANSNNGDHVAVAKRKIYTGKREGGVFSINVLFPETMQENYYNGSILVENEKKIFKGRFTLLSGNLARKIGTGGKMEGLVESV